MKTISTMGTAQLLSTLPGHIDWILRGQRDLELQDPAMPNFPEDFTPGNMAELKSLLDGYEGRLGIHGPFIGFNMTAGIEKAVGAAVMDRYRKALEFAAEIRAGHMVLHSPFSYFGANPFSTVNAMEGALNELSVSRDFLGPLVEEAEDAGCVLVIENIMDKNPELLRKFVDSFRSDCVQMSLDVGHAYITSQEGGPRPDQWVLHAGDLLGHIHIQDTDGQTDRHWAPGCGEVNWFAFFEALGRLEQNPRMVLELKDPSKTLMGFRHLEEIWDTVNSTDAN